MGHREPLVVAGRPRRAAASPRICGSSVDDRRSATSFRPEWRRQDALFAPAKGPPRAGRSRNRGAVTRTCTPGTPARFTVTIPTIPTATRRVMGTFAQLGRALLVKRLRDGRAATAAKGGKPSGSYSFGWSTDRPVDGEQDVASVVATLHRQGSPPPDGRAPEQPSRPPPPAGCMVDAPDGREDCGTHDGIVGVTRSPDHERGVGREGGREGGHADRPETPRFTLIASTTTAFRAGSRPLSAHLRRHHPPGCSRPLPQRQSHQAEAAGRYGPSCRTR